MKPAIFISLCVFVTASTGQFKSEYTDFDDCEWISQENMEGGDGAQECKGKDEYYAYEYYSADATIRKIYSRTNPDFQILLAPMDDFKVSGHGNKIEWRYNGDHPIAIIYRVTVNDTDENAKNTIEYLLIRGLDRYSNIEDDINVKSAKNANARARKVLDSLYTEYYLKSGIPKDPL